MISLKQVSKRYGAIVALADISIEIGAGEFVFIKGPSGVGKSTLFKIILREELPTRGSVVVGDRNVVKLPPAKRPYHRRNFGVVFQDFKLLPNKTVIENVGFALQIHGLSRKEVWLRAGRVLGRVGLQDKRNAFPRQLAGGEQQRVAIARALVNEPPIILADEPTANIDQQRAYEILKLLVEVNRMGTTVLVATHNPNLVKSFDNKRVIELSDHRITRNEVVV